MATAGADVDRLLRRLAKADDGGSKRPWSTDEDTALVRTLSRLQDLLTSVEEQSFEGTKMQKRLVKIKQMAYQIEDVLEESEDPTIIPSGIVGPSRMAMFFCSYMLHSTMAQRMRTIRKKLDRVAEDFILSNLLQPTRSSLEISSVSELLPGTAIVGRDNDKKIIEELLSQNNSETLSIIPIVGLEGLGKTTLARSIFYGNREGSSFDVCVWVDLNKNLDLNSIASEIISQANKTDKRIPEINTNDQIQESLQSIKNRLQEVLHDKSGLIVLDDLWSTDKSQLAELKDMLKGKRTKVIVTTCSEITAELMQNNESYRLGSLSEDDCWTIFSQRAFGNGDEGFISRITETRKEILERCEGMPALAHYLGSIVHNQGMYIWSAVRDEVFLPFKQIYYNMPFALRSCFVYLSTFPKGSSIDKEKLIQEWTALDILGSKDRALPASVQGKAYIQELLSISFLQAPNTPVTGTNQSNDPVALNIHNLVHDFAIHVAGDDLIILNNGKVVSGRVGKPAFRYALLTNYNGQSTLNKVFLSKARALHLSYFQATKLLGEAFSVLKHLRILDLSRCGIVELPDSIGQLKLLRCFDGSELKIQAMPESFCGLQELRFLNLSSCIRLKELPESFGELTNVEHLNLSSCSELKQLPESFRRLHFLRFLRLSSSTEYQQFQEFLKSLVNLNFVTPSDTRNVAPSVPTHNAGTNEGPCSTYDELEISNLALKGTKRQLFKESTPNLNSSEIQELPDPGMTISTPKRSISADEQPYATHSEADKLEVQEQPYASRNEHEISNLEVEDSSLHTVESSSELQQFPQPLGNIDNLEVRELPGNLEIALPTPKYGLGTGKQPCAPHDKPEVGNLKVRDSSLQTAESSSELPEFQESLVDSENLEILKHPDPGIRLPPYATQDEAEAVSNLAGGDRSLQTAGRANPQQIPEIQPSEHTSQEVKIHGKIEEDMEDHACQHTDESTDTTKDIHDDIIFRWKKGAIVGVSTGVVSVATGVMSPLLDKLSTLIEKKYSMLKEVHDDILFLKDELSSMHAFLVKLEEVDDLDIQMKEWRNQVRELSYDIDDCIDDFMHRVDRGSDMQKGFFQNIVDKLKTLRARHDVAEQIQELKDRVDHLTKRRKIYNFDGTVSDSSGVVPIDPWLTALYAGKKCLVGMDGPKDEIIKLLTQGEEESVQKLRLVSICGFGGVGKTTLANQIYRQLEGQFDCQAFVSASQKPDLVRLLSKILSEVKGQQSVPIYEVKDLIDEIRRYMQHKRYFIVIDDMWDALAWDAIRCAFPENNYGSRVITTIRIESLAASCSIYEHGYVYKMKPLNEEDAKRLFFSRIFGSEDTCPLQFKKISVEILKKCGGLPLAIISIASLLASHPIMQIEQWEYVQNHLDAMFGKDPILDGMRQILNLSYMNLPHYLKTCFLYLGTYPEDYLIRKDDLARRWVAEGFVRNVRGQDAENVADSYFNELVNRSVIQPIYDRFVPHRVSLCKVHDMMLDLIISKCQEENFVTILDNARDMIGLRSKVRRLSLQFDEAKHGTLPATISQSQARSLTIIRGSDYSHMLTLSEFRLLRVLDLDFGSYAKTALNLTGMCFLFQLRYFKIQLPSYGTYVRVQLPTQIQRLQYLETFKIATCYRFSATIIIPTDIVYLPGLLHLIIPWGKRLPDRIGNMKSLRTLEFDLAVNTRENIKGLGELTNLRSLHLDCSANVTIYRDLRDVLSASLGKIICCNLRDLQVSGWYPVPLCDGLVCLSPSRSNLQVLWLSAWSFSRVPKWIGEIHNLNTLRLNVRKLLKDDVRILAGLPALITLHLDVLWAPKEGIIIYGTAFPVLKYFSFVCRTACRFTFEAGAMPNLQRLKLSVRAREVKQCTPLLVGIEHLSGLQEIDLEIRGDGAEESEMKAAEFALRNAINMHTSCPAVKIRLEPVVDEEED